MRENTKTTTRKAQANDSIHDRYQCDRDVIARLLAKLLVKMYLNGGQVQEMFPKCIDSCTEVNTSVLTDSYIRSNLDRSL